MVQETSRSAVQETSSYAVTEPPRVPRCGARACGRVSVSRHLDPRVRADCHGYDDPEEVDDEEVKVEEEGLGADVAELGVVGGEEVEEASVELTEGREHHERIAPGLGRRHAVRDRPAGGALDEGGEGLHGDDEGVAPGVPGKKGKGRATVACRSRSEGHTQGTRNGLTGQERD